MEAGTLRQLKVQHGDKVEIVGHEHEKFIGMQCEINEKGDAVAPDNNIFAREHDSTFGRMWRIISDEQPENAPKSHHEEYRRGVVDAILWLLANNTTYKPEFLAENMQEDLL